jgi:hypothetical protein
MAVVGSASQGVDNLNVDGFEAFALQELDVEDGINREQDTEKVEGPIEGSPETDEGADEQPEGDDAEGSDAEDAEASDSEDDDSQAEDEEGPAEAEGDDDLEDFVEWEHRDYGPVRVALNELRDGYMRTEDYTRKTTSLNDEARAHQNRVQEWEQIKERELLFLQANAPQKPQWDSDDPIGSAETQHRYNEEMQQRGMFLQQQEQRQAEAQMRFAAEQAALLPRRIPEWATPEVSNREKAGVRDLLLSSGYTEDEVNSVADSRAVAIARKAFLYDQMMAEQKSKTAVAKKKVAKKPPVPVRSAGPTPRPKGDPRKARLVKAHRQKGSADSMADILMADMMK